MASKGRFDKIIIKQSVSCGRELQEILYRAPLKLFLEPNRSAETKAATSWVPRIQIDRNRIPMESVRLLPTMAECQI